MSFAKVQSFQQKCKKNVNYFFLKNVSLPLHQDAEDLAWGIGPLLHGIKGLLRYDLATDETVNGTGATLQVVDDSTEVAGLGVTRAPDVELLLYEILGLERYLCLCVADADDTAGEGYLIDCHLVGDRAAHGFDDHVWAEAGGHF